MKKDIPKGAYTSANITNAGNPLVADKLQFFTDCLQLLCLKSGEFYHFEVESHISLLHNLLFYADGEINSLNPKPVRIKNTIKQIKFIVETHPFFESNDGIVKIDVGRMNQIRNLLDSLRDEPHSDMINLVNIREYLTQIEKLISPTYLDDMVKILFSILICNHQLNHHKRDLEEVAMWVFSHFFFKGHSREQIHGFIRRILANKINRQGDRIYTEAPLPEDLYQRIVNHNTTESAFDQKLNDDIQRYIDNRTFKQQIDGFINISRYKKYTFSYIFRVDAIMLWPENFDLLGLKVMDINYFINSHSAKELEYAMEFLKPANHSALIEVKVDAYSHDEAVRVALDTLREKLGTIARRTGGRFSINQTGYTFYPSKGEQFWINTMPEPGKLSRFDIEHVEYMETNILNSAHKELYVTLENILTNAYTDDNKSISLHYIRKFMQCLFENIDSSSVTNENGIPKEIRTLAFLLVRFERNRFISETHQWATNIVLNWSGTNENDGSDGVLKDKIRKTNGDITLKEIISLSSLKHVKYNALRARYYSKKIDEKDAYNYYVRQLLFIKQYRDKHEHASVLDDQVARKLGLYSYALMNRLLDNSFKELNKKGNRGLSHKAILKNLVDNSLSKLTC